jgi:hypothetical protein
MADRPAEGRILEVPRVAIVDRVRERVEVLGFDDEIGGRERLAPTPRAAEEFAADRRAPVAGRAAIAVRFARPPY